MCTCGRGHTHTDRDIPNPLCGNLITPIAFYFLTSGLKNNAALALSLDEVFAVCFLAYQCTRDLLCDLVSCNLWLLIRRLQKGWDERRSD